MTVEASTVQAAYDRAITRASSAAAIVEQLEKQLLAAMDEWDASRLDLDARWADMYRAGLFNKGRQMAHRGLDEPAALMRRAEKFPSRRWWEGLKRAERAAQGAEDDTVG